jgi:hypothetical protein
VKTTISTVVRELLGLVFWAYALLKVFVFDIDLYLLNATAPQYSWLLSFKFFIIAGSVASLLALVRRDAVIVGWLLYILFYPFILFLWHIPRLIYRQRSIALAFAAANACISFFRSLKYNFITAVLFLGALTITISSSHRSLLWGGLVTLFVLLMLAYVHRLTLCFRPSAMYQLYSKLLAAVRDQGATAFGLDPELKGLPPAVLDPKQLEKRTTNLQNLVFFNRLCLLVARGLRDYQDSRIVAVSYAMSLIVLIVLTVLGFAGIHDAIYKIDPAAFNATRPLAFFQFIYYSFNSVVFNAVPEVTPVGPLAQAAVMTQQFLSLLVSLIFVTLLFTIHGERHSSELDTVVKNLQAQGVAMEVLLREQFRVTLPEALAELERAKTTLIGVIYWLSARLVDDK